VDKLVALVTGGGSGIGLETANCLTRDYQVIAADLAFDLQTTRMNKTVSYEMDVTSQEAWRNLLTLVERDYGRLDSMIFSAGVAPILGLNKTSATVLHKVLDVNLTSIMIGVQVFWELLKYSKSSIVIVASVAGLVGQNYSAPYSASKGGAISLTRALATELAQFGVRVNSVSPGPTNTKMIQRHFDSLQSGTQARNKLIQRMPIGRLLDPAEVAKPIQFLLSSDASAITGCNLVVDGGLTATFDYGNEFAGGATYD
jgi:NAD(P)-dependent dehydrogenase (short-subunit alcohol dehydrogenase family)